MKFTLSWLKEHLDTAASVAEIAEALTDLGLEVEELIDPLDRLRGFTIGRIKVAEKHPDADRLSVCVVETDEGDRQIICGAPNARAGITVVVCKPGQYIPGIDTTIQVGKIRGVESHGMMASERELELSDEHDGIIELPSGAVGESFADWMAANAPERVDPVFDIAITPNRPDALGVRGIARDLAARGLGVLRPEPRARIEGGFDCPIGVSIAEDSRAQAPLFMGRLVRGVTNRPSPDWLQTRLRAIGLRPISALVDITNFFTYDLNRPLHVFDAGKLSGDLRVHRARGGETLLGLDEREYVLAPGMVAISDDSGVVSIAGIMGGLPSGVSAATGDVFVESALWDPVDIARTGRALKLNSDARYRFERGVDPAFAGPGLELATRMILDLCGGEASKPVQAGAVPDVARAYRFDPGRVRSLVGMEIPADEQRATLAALGFRLDEDDMAWVPSWRPDVQGEADLVEEVARIASLSRLEGKPLARLSDGVPRPVLTPLQKREGIARRQTAALGYNECVTYSFIDRDAAARFGGGAEATMLENPISSEMSHLRPSLIPGLLAAAARNQARGFSDLALFEVGPVFHGGEPEEMEQMLTGILVGQSGPRERFATRRPVDVFDAKADLEAVLAAIGAPARLMHLRETNRWWHPGRSAKLSLGPKNPLGAFGELHPRVIEAAGVKGPVVAFALHLERLAPARARPTTRPALRVSDLQAVERDFAFVVERGVEAQALVAAAAAADRRLIEEVRLFDEFTGGALGAAGQKSLAVTVRLQPTDKTLTEAEIDAVSQKIIAKVEKATGGKLRT